MRLIWSATVATGASPLKKPSRMRAPSWMRRAMSVKRSKYLSSRGSRLSMPLTLSFSRRKEAEDGRHSNSGESRRRAACQDTAWFPSQYRASMSNRTAMSIGLEM